MRLAHLLFNYPLPLLIIVMDSALMTGDESVSEQWNMKPRRGHPGRGGRRLLQASLALSLKTLRHRREKGQNAVSPPSESGLITCRRGRAGAVLHPWASEILG